MKIEEYLKKMPHLETDRLLLRKIEAEDLDDIFEFSSDPFVAHHMTWEVNRTKEETWEKFLKRALAGYEKGQSGDAAIIFKKTRKVIGTCSYIDWSNQHNSAEIGYVLNRHYWGFGYATEAVKELIKFGFEHMQLNRIQGRCDHDNFASEKVMQKSGMLFEGILRKSEFIKGEFRDTKVFSILREEYLISLTGPI